MALLNPEVLRRGMCHDPADAEPRRVTLCASISRRPLPDGLRRAKRAGEARPAARRGHPHPDPHLLQGASEDALRKEAARNLDFSGRRVRDGPDEAGGPARRLRRPARGCHFAAPCDSDAIGGIWRPAAAGIPVFTVDIAAHGGTIVSRHIAMTTRRAGDWRRGHSPSCSTTKERSSSSTIPRSRRYRIGRAASTRKSPSTRASPSSAGRPRAVSGRGRWR